MGTSPIRGCKTAQSGVDKYDFRCWFRCVCTVWDKFRLSRIAIGWWVAGISSIQSRLERGQLGDERMNLNRI